MTKESKIFGEDADVARSGTLRRWDDPEDISEIDEQQETVPFSTH